METVNPRNLKVPALNIDNVLHPNGMNSRHRAERRVMWALLWHMQKNGFDAVGVFDGEEYTRTYSKVEVMELVFNLDEASVRFAPVGKSKEQHGVLVVFGNLPEELVSDWNYYEDDRDEFNAIMEAFDAEQFA